MQKTLGRAVDRWLKIRERKCKNPKWVGYDRTYTAFFLEKLGEDTLLSDIRRSDIADIRDEMLEERCPATVNRYMTTLRSILNMARDDWEWIDRVPKIERLEEKARQNFITREQARTLIELLPEHLAAMVRFVLATGLRSANVRNLRWDQVDIRQKYLEIPGEEMKNGRVFSAPLNSTAIEVLLGQYGKHQEYVFPYKGKPVSQCNTRAFREACRRAGIPGTRFHDLRHSWASWHIQAGTHTAKLRELGGWSDDKMVQRYAHLNRRHLEEDVEVTAF